MLDSPDDNTSPANVAELVYAQDLGSCGFGREGSNPSVRTRRHPNQEFLMFRALSTIVVTIAVSATVGLTAVLGHPWFSLFGSRLEAM